MAASNYSEAIKRVLASEGGYVNHPADPGGPTNFGITQAVYRANGHPGATASDVKAMPLAEAKRIYKLKYADPVHFDDDPAGLDYTLFDYGVNSGVGRANKVIRRVCALADNAPYATLVTALAKRDPKAVISAVNAERLRFLQGLSTWPTFGAGWGSRVKSVNTASLKMAEIVQVAPNPPISIPVHNPEITPGKGEVPKPKTGGAVVSTGGVGSVAAGGSWWDWVIAHPALSIVAAVAGLVAIGAIAEFAARRWQAYAQEAPTPDLILVPETKAVTP